MRRRFAPLVALLLLPLVCFGPADAATVTDPAAPAVVRLDGRYIVQLGEGVDVDSFLADHAVPPDSVQKYVRALKGFTGYFTSGELSAFDADRRVASIEHDDVVTADQTIDPTGRDNAWGLDQVDQRSTVLDKTYVAVNTGSGVTAYVLDTGVYAGHTDFGGRVAAGWSYRAQDYFFTDPDGPGAGNPLKSPVETLGSCKSDPNYSAAAHPYDVDTYDFTKDSSADGRTDNEGHGTHVAGTIGGATYGVAKSVTIVPVQILNSCGSGLTSMALAGIEWVIGHHANGAKAVANMSIGFSSTVGSVDCVINGTNTETNATCADYLLREGVSVTAAAGNEGTTACGNTPASTLGTISIGAVVTSITSSSLTESSYSNYGDCVDIFAPGTYIKSTWTAASGNPTKVESGTSMAAPHVAGVVAAYLQTASLPADMSTLPGQVWSWMKQQATCNVVTYASRATTPRTPNRMLYLGTDAVVPCAPRNVAATQANAKTTVTWSEVATGNGSAITGYQVTTSPSSNGCTSSSAVFTCDLTDLAAGTTYTINVKAVNGVGAGTAGTSTVTVTSSGGAGATPTTTPPTTAPLVTTTTPSTTAPQATTTMTLPPAAPASADTSSTGSSITVTWPAVGPIGSVTYVVTITPGGLTCTTLGTTCVFNGVTAGVNYTFKIATKNTSGSVSSSALTVTSTAGFTQKIASVKVRSKTILTRIVKTVSTGRRTYRVVSGRCRISTGRLVAPSTAGTCRVKVSVARTSRYKTMSTTVTLTVTA